MTDTESIAQSVREEFHSADCAHCGRALLIQKPLPEAPDDMEVLFLCLRCKVEHETTELPC